MKKILLMMAMTLPMIAFTSCSKDDESAKVIKNLSGTNWYDTQIWFMNSTDSESLDWYQEVGDVGIGESCTVNSDKPYFYIYAKDSRGNLVMSQPKPLLESNSISEDDLYW